MLATLKDYLPKATFAAISLLGLSLTSAQSAEQSAYPLKINNCGRVLEFQKPPESVVSVGQNSTEILYLLGLGDKIKGTALWFQPVMTEFKEQNDKVERLSNDVPSYEAIISKKPDLIANQFEWVIGPVGAAAGYDQFEEINIPVYTSPADCESKDNLAGSDGLRSKPFNMTMIYQEIDDLARIFNVEPRGQKLIAELKDREQAAISRKKALPSQKLSGFMWYSSPAMEMEPYVAGQLGAPGYMFKTLGIDNIIKSDFDWPNVGWETIVKADPSIIVIAKMQRRRFPADDIKVKEEFLQNDPVASLMSAAKQHHIIELDVQAMNGTIHTIKGIEALADAISKMNITASNLKE
ncbi:ABC transporter substrate-binding protein [Bartonella sp. HY761]|uniref:ABC transporter substrate-binding protein n=1 Tax=Bartonella sp. HY761 TaxID=2979330 RepID=UPI0021F9C47A|nr:ABC transporter substrate-binding protein [Bartonella sp. HY761]UXN06756.1 ABC transporter substrate-binding protein [Bartonella sp. HY761]